MRSLRSPAGFVALTCSLLLRLASATQGCKEASHACPVAPRELEMRRVRAKGAGRPCNCRHVAASVRGCVHIMNAVLIRRLKHVCICLHRTRFHNSLLNSKCLLSPSTLNSRKLETGLPRPCSPVRFCSGVPDTHHLREALVLV